MIDNEFDDSTNHYAGSFGSRDEPRWGTCKSIVFVVLVSLGLWAAIWCGVNSFIQTLAPGY